MSNNMKPRIRFKGFTDAWEQRKLGNLVIDHNAGIYISKEKYGLGTNIIGVGNIYDNDIFDGQKYRLAPVNDKRFLLEEGDLIYGESSLVPEGIARTVCVGKNGAGSAFAWHTRRLKMNKELLDSHFATLEINYHPNVRKYLISASTQTALTGMTTDGYFGTILVLPTLKEQQKISNLFKNMDNLITLHQRKYEKLINIKKSLLEKMFPKNNSNIPEIRFKGFTDAWEQRKLKEMTIYKNGNGHEDKQTTSGKYELINLNSVSIDGGLKSSGKFINDSNETLKENDLVMVLSDVGHGDLLGRVAIIPENNRFVLNQRVALLRTNDTVHPRFLFTCINAGQSYFKTNGAGSSQLNISKNIVEEFEPYIPKKEEQIYISNIFENIDNLITLHQRKHDKLVKIKQSLLKDMFV